MDCGGFKKKSTAIIVVLIYDYGCFFVVFLDDVLIETPFPVYFMPIALRLLRELGSLKISRKSRLVLDERLLRILT